MEESILRKGNHEAFVSGHNGSLPLDVILSVMPIVPGAIIASSYAGCHLSLWNFSTEYVFCVLPLILSFTVWKDANLELNAGMFFLLLLRVIETQKDNRSERKNTIIRVCELPSLTSSRATVNIATIIAILAVDFHIFPRRFAKTEKYGYSLMDVGAACYLFMNGITDSRKQLVTSNYMRNTLLVAILGLFRVISVKATNYQEHITEYGVHCNFFFTLSVIKFINIFGISKLKSSRKAIAIVSLMALHQIALYSGLESWAMSEGNRNGLLEANREWFVSLPGNFSIYLIGQLVGDFILSDDRKWSEKLIRYSILPVIPFTCLFICQTVFLMEPSRRVANIPFVFWIAGFFLLFLTLYGILEDLFSLGTCFIFASVNKHALSFFLLGNFLTGAINLSLDTLNVSNFGAFVIVNLYCYSLTYIMYYSYRKS